MALDNTKFGAQYIAKVLDGKKNLFFCGIGGVSMCSLAHISRLRGHEVSGYDRSPSAATEALEKLGITVYYEEDASHIEGIDALIYTVAIPETNPEYAAAMKKGISSGNHWDLTRLPLKAGLYEAVIAILQYF